MMKRLLLPGYLILLWCLMAFTVQANAQDTTKKVTPAKVVVKHAVPFKAKQPATTPAAHTDTPVKNLRTQIDPSQLNDKSLAGQYQYLLTKSYHYQEPLMTALWKNFRDTLNQERRQVKELQAKLAAQSQTVTGLKTDVTNKEQSLAEINAKVDNISIFGLLLPKATYNLVMFGIAGALALALIIVIATTAKYKHEARHRTELYEEIEEEYKTFKAKANEKELKLARELQTERNKLDELLGRG